MSAIQARLRALNHPLLLSLYLPWLIFTFSESLLVPVLPLYAGTFEVSYGLIGAVLAGEAIGTLIGDLPAGVLLRRMGNRRMMLLGIGCVALTTVALFWAQTILMVFALRVVAGIGRAMYQLAQHAHLAGAISTGKRGRALAIYGGVSRLGALGGPVVGGLIAAHFGLRATFLLFGITCTAGLLLLAFFLRGSRLPRGEIRTRSAHAGHLLATLRAHARVMSSAGAGMLFAQTIRAGRVAIIPLYAAEVIGLDVDAIGLVLGITALVDMSLFPVAGWIMDRFGRKHAIIPSFAIQGLGMALIPFSGDFAGLLLATAVVGLGNGIGSATMLTLGADLAPEDARGEFLGVWRLVGDVGHMGGPMAVGAVADVVRLETAPFVLAGIGLLSAAIFLFRVPETLAKRPAPAGD
jgi:MFS family permease